MTETRWLGAREQRAWRGYLAMQAQLQATLHRRLQADAGLSLADFDVLVALSDRAGEPVRAGELAGLLQWEKSRLSHHLARMERRGLVAREEPPPEAGRTRHVYACTESGEEAFLAWLRSGRDEPQGVDAGFVLDHPFLKLLFASRLTAEERAAKLDRTEEVARERLASLDRLDDGARGTVGAVLLDVGRRREEAVLEAVARLRAGG